MCQPPEITIQGQAEGFEQATSNEGWNSSDGWVSPSPRNQTNATWREDGLHSSQDNNQALNNLAAQFVKYGQHQQQQQQRTGQIAWPQGLGQNLAEKLQQAAANATAHKHQSEQSALNWMARQQGMQQPMPSFPSAAVAVATPQMWQPSPVMAQRPGGPPMMASLTPQLVAQGIPMGMPQMGQVDLYGQLHEDDEELDPKKYKRMMSNRASAKRSRQRRQERLDELEIVSAKLQVENATVQRKLHEAQDRIKKFQQDNESLLEELKTLKELLGCRGGAQTHTTTNSHPNTTSPGTGTMTKQDSCGPNGSTTDNPSSEPSSAPSPCVGGKRRFDQVAESRFQGEDEGLEGRRVKTQSQVTPSSGTTSNSGEQEDVTPVVAEGPRERGDAVIIQGEMGILDDDLFTTFMDDCFEAKPLDVALARH